MGATKPLELIQQSGGELLSHLDTFLIGPVGLVQFNRFGLFRAQTEVQNFHENGEGHSEVDIALANMLAQAIGN